MTTYLNDIRQALVDGADDVLLNDIIQSFLASYGTGETVAEWRRANYDFLRRWAYPDKAEYLDAMVKMATGGSLGLEGQAQRDAYVNACINVKLRFPKI